MNDVSALTELLNRMVGTVATGFGILGPDVARVYNTLVGLSIIFTVSFLVLQGRLAAHAAVVGQLLKIGFFTWLLSGFQPIMQAVLQSSIAYGSAAAGYQLPASNFGDPGLIAHMGIVAMEPIRSHLDKISGFPDVFLNLPQVAIYLLCMLFILVGFMVLAWQVFVTLLEFHLLAIMAFLCVPFAVLNHTAFVAERALGYVVATGLKVGTLALVVSLSYATISNVTWSAEPTLREALGVVAVTGATFLLAVLVPRAAAGLVNGGPVLDAGQALGLFWGSAWSAARVAAPAVRAGPAPALAAAVGGMALPGAAAGSAAPATPAAAPAGPHGAAGVLAGLRARAAGGRGGAP